MIRCLTNGTAFAMLLTSSPCFAQAPRTVAEIEADLKAMKVREADLLIEKHRAEISALEAWKRVQGVAPPQAPPPAAPPPAAAGNPPPALPAELPAPPVEAATAKPDEKANEQKNADTTKATGMQNFGGLEFGVGIAFTYDLGNRDRIREAELDANGLVRVTRSENLRARLILESHYLFTPAGKFLTLESGKWGVGPFVALQGGSDSVIEAVGAGFMLGLKRPSEDDKSTASFNIGLGVMYDLNSQVLGDDIRENQPLPPNETDIRFRTQSQSGLLIMSSYSF